MHGRILSIGNGEHVTHIDLPPRCPVCAGQTMLKDMRKLPEEGSYMCFFHCLSCAIEYPCVVEQADAIFAGLIKATPPSPHDDI